MIGNLNPPFIEEKQITEINLDYNPYNLCILPNQQILVSDHIKNQLILYDENFNVIKIVSSFDNLLFLPLGLTTNEIDKIYICDYKFHRILCVDFQFRLIKRFGMKGNGNQNLLHPYDVFYFKDIVYVCDHGNKRITQLTPDLEFIVSNNLMYEPWQIRVLNKKAFIRSFDEKSIYIHDLTTFDIIKRIDGQNGIICQFDSHVYELDTKNSKINCYASNGVLINYIDVCFQNIYFYNLFGFEFLKKRNVFVASAGEKFLLVPNNLHVVQIYDELWS
jgi:hypothetical protein